LAKFQRCPPHFFGLRILSGSLISCADDASQFGFHSRLIGQLLADACGGFIQDFA